MKKFVTAMVLVMVLTSIFCAYAEYDDGLAAFVDSFDFDMVEGDDGSGTMNVTCNDRMNHSIIIYIDSVEANTCIMTVYRNGEQVGETKLLSYYDYEYAVEDFCMKLYKIETVYEDYEAGKVSKEYFDEMTFKYRTTLW